MFNDDRRDYLKPGKTLLSARFHFGLAFSSCSRASTSVGVWRWPSKFNALCLAHSLRFCVGVGGGSQSCGLAAVDAGGGGAGPVGILDTGCGDGVAVAFVAAISISAGRFCVRSGALKIRRPVTALPIDPKAPRA